MEIFPPKKEFFDTVVVTWQFSRAKAETMSSGITSRFVSKKSEVS